MYQKIKSLVFRMLIPAVLAVCMLPLTAFAQEPCVVTIPVTVSVDGRGIPSDVAYKFVLEAVTPGAPMPASAELTIVNAGEGSFDPISYTVPGDYEYRVRQTTEERNRFTFDTSVYTLTVRITNKADGTLGSEIWAVKGEETAKAGGLSFANQYRSSGSSGGGGGGGGGGGSPTGKHAVSTGDGLSVPSVPAEPVPGETLPEPAVVPNVVPIVGLPQTGDTTQLGLWIALAAVSGLSCAALLIWKKRRDMEGCRA